MAMSLIYNIFSQICEKINNTKFDGIEISKKGFYKLDIFLDI